MPKRNILALLATLLLVIVARIYFVETFAIPLPFWDQWDAEGDTLLRPWIEGGCISGTSGSLITSTVFSPRGCCHC